MQRKTAWAIAQTLTNEKIPTPSGKSTNWRVSVINSILTNEKYKGAALLQKKFTVDYLTKKMKLNEGEVPQYYVENSHEAIIPPDEWERVQKELIRRKSFGRRLKLSILVDIFLQGFFSNVSSSEGADLKPLRSVATKRFQIAARPISLYHAALLTESSYLRRFSIGGSPPLAVQILRLFQ